MRQEIRAHLVQLWDTFPLAIRLCGVLSQEAGTLSSGVMVLVSL
jgi:hypothetical protein